jgi:hypothetical protein
MTKPEMMDGLSFPHIIQEAAICPRQLQFDPIFSNDFPANINNNNKNVLIGSRQVGAFCPFHFGGINNQLYLWKRDHVYVL